MLFPTRPRTVWPENNTAASFAPGEERTAQEERKREETRDTHAVVIRVLADAVRWALVPSIVAVQLLHKASVASVVRGVHLLDRRGAHSGFCLLATARKQGKLTITPRRSPPSCRRPPSCTGRPPPARRRPLSLPCDSGDPGSREVQVVDVAHQARAQAERERC